MKIVAIMIVKSRSIFDIESIKIINQQYEIFFCFERDSLVTIIITTSKPI